jgi:proline dehydrogenase
MRHGFARRFVAGETLDEAMVASTELWSAGRRVVLNLLGENVSTVEEARHACDAYLAALSALDAARPHGHVVAGDSGNISIKLTQLGLDFDRDGCLALTMEIAAAAKALGRTIEIDMESTSYTDRTLDIYEATQRAHGNVGLAIQAYLHRSAEDLERLAALASGASRVKIRLVKGAYHEPAAAAFQKKTDVDANYRKLLDRLLRPADGFVTAIATHDPTLVAYAIERIRDQGLGADRYEFQMIYGIRRDLQEQVHRQGHPFRVYVPFGTAWVPYFMRRLSERPANLWFVLRSLIAERKSKS